MGNKIFLVLVISLFLISACAKTTDKMPVKENSFITSDKSVNDRTVIIDTAYLERPGYVVVRKDNNGTPGGIIGNSKLISGTKNGIELTISEEADVRVFAELYYDNGDSAFNSDSDIASEAENATIQLYKIGIGGTSDSGKVVSTTQFESAKVAATILEIYSSNEDIEKEFGKIRIDRIVWQSANGSLREGDIVNIFFPYGTKERRESSCPREPASPENEGGLLPVAVGTPCFIIEAINVKKGDNVLGQFENNLADTSNQRTTFNPRTVLNSNPPEPAPSPFPDKDYPLQLKICEGLSKEDCFANDNCAGSYGPSYCSNGSESTVDEGSGGTVEREFFFCTMDLVFKGCGPSSLNSEEIQQIKNECDKINGKLNKDEIGGYECLCNQTVEGRCLQDFIGQLKGFYRVGSVNIS